jgi:hypothetical protein
MLSESVALVTLSIVSGTLLLPVTIHTLFIICSKRSSVSLHDGAIKPETTCRTYCTHEIVDTVDIDRHNMCGCFQQVIREVIVLWKTYVMTVWSMVRTLGPFFTRVKNGIYFKIYSHEQVWSLSSQIIPAELRMCCVITGQALIQKQSGQANVVHHPDPTQNIKSPKPSGGLSKSIHQ